MNVRYCGGGTGVRLDTGEGRSGPAVDLDRRSLFARDAADRSVVVDLTVRDLTALRDGISAILVETGHEEFVQVPIPRRR